MASTSAFQKFFDVLCKHAIYIFAIIFLKISEVIKTFLTYSFICFSSVITSICRCLGSFDYFLIFYPAITLLFRGIQEFYRLYVAFQINHHRGWQDSSVLSWLHGSKAVYFISRSYLFRQYRENHRVMTQMEEEFTAIHGSQELHWLQVKAFSDTIWRAFISFLKCSLASIYEAAANEDYQKIRTLYRRILYGDENDDDFIEIE